MTAKTFNRPQNQVPVQPEIAAAGPKSKRKTPKRKPKPLPFVRRWISVNEAAGLLSLDPNSIYRLIKRGIIIPARLGRTVRLDLPALEKQLAASSSKR